MKGSVRMLVRFGDRRARLVAFVDIVDAARALSARGLPLAELPLDDALRLVLDYLGAGVEPLAA